MSECHPTSDEDGVTVCAAHAMRGDNDTFNEDAIVDLAGYLVLYLSLDLEESGS